MNKLGKFAVAGLLGGLVLGATMASAAPIVLKDGNSVAVVDPLSSAGMYDWFVDGQDELHQQWFWFRIEGVNGQEYSIDTIGAPVINQSSQDHATVTYTGAGFSIQVSYTLNGGSAGSGISDVSEDITIVNTSTAGPMTIHFFQYSDFDLNGTAGDDSVALDGGGFIWNQTDGAFSLTESITSGVPKAQHYEAGNFGSDPLSKLTDGDADVLNDDPDAGPGDVTWAWQWDRDIAAGGSFLISKDKTLHIQVPAPGAALLLGLGLGVVGWIKRRMA